MLLVLEGFKKFCGSCLRMGQVSLGTNVVLGCLSLSGISSGIELAGRCAFLPGRAVVYAQ